MTITTVLMFWIHCGATVMPQTCRSTLLTANSCRLLGAIWYSAQNTREPSVRIRYAHMLLRSRGSRCLSVSQTSTAATMAQIALTSVPGEPGCCSRNHTVETGRASRGGRGGPDVVI